MPGLKSAPPQKATSDKPPRHQQVDGARSKKRRSSSKPDRSPRGDSNAATASHSKTISQQSTQPASQSQPSSQPTKAAKANTAAAATPATTDDVAMDADEHRQQPDSTKPALVSASNPFLQLFWQLADENEAKRQQAQDKLITTLTAEQTQHTASLPSPPPTTPSPDILHPNLRYALKRLLRGLCSSRAAARTGFAACLTQLLLSFPVIPSAFLLSTFTSQLTLPQSPSKQEQTDFKLGHATAVLALCRAKRVGGAETVDGVEAMVRRLVREAKSKVVRETAWEAVRAVMDSVGWKEYKSWMEPFVLKQLAATDETEDDEEEEQTKVEEEEDEKPTPKKQKKGNDNKSAAAVKPKKSTAAPPSTTLLELSSLTPERLSILLTMHELYRQQQQSVSVALSSVLAPSCLSPLSVAHFGALVDILSSAAYTLPTLHSVYGRVFVALLAQDGGEWLQLYELLAASLFADRTSMARKHQGLLLFGQLVAAVTQSPLRASLASDVAALLHPLLLRTLLNNLSSPDTHLHSVARNAQHALLTAARTQPSIILPVLQRLLAAHGRWDAITKSKTVSTLVSLLTTDDLHRYVQTLMQSFHSGELKQPAAGADNDEEKEASDADGVERHDLWVLDSLYAATRHAALVDATVLDVALMERVMRFFLFYGFFDPTTRKQQQQPPPSAKKSKKRKAAADHSDAPTTAADATSDVCRSLLSPLSPRVREVCQTRMWSLLDDLLPRSKRQQSQQPQTAGEESDSASAASTILWSQLAHQYWSETEKAGYALLQPVSEDGRQARETMLERVRTMEERRLTAVQDKVEKEGETAAEAHRLRARQERGLSVLLLHVGLLLLSEEENATALLQELDMGCQQLWKQPTDPKPKPAKQPKKLKPADSPQQADNEADELQPVFIEVLVDIVLSLLVRPSALVRNVCKLVFAAWASEVNERALSDVMRVVVKRAPVKEKSGEEGDDEDDEDEFQPFDVSDVEADEDEEDEEGSDAEQPAKGDKASKKRKAPPPPSRHANEDNDDDEEDEELIDLDTLDDVLGQPLTAAEQSAVDAASAQFDHYDHHLANIIKLRQQNNKTAQDDLVQQQVNFQLRALDLLDIYVKQQPSSRLILELLLLPAVDAVKATRKSDKVKGLHERLVALVKAVARSKQHPTVVWPVETKETEGKGKKGKSKKSKVNEQEDEKSKAEQLVGMYETRIDSVRAAINALMERTKHAADSEHVALLSSSILYLVRLSLPATALVSTAAQSTLPAAAVAHLDSVRSLYHAAVTSYLTTRHSHFNTRFFTDYITTAPAIAIHSLPLLAQLTRTPLPTTDTEATDQPLAATAFLRLDAMSFVSLLCGQSKLMAQQPAAVVEEVGRAVGEGVESMVRWVGLTDDEKRAVREKERERLQDGKEAAAGEEDAEAEETSKADVSKLSKEERLKLKQKNKKKRRQQRKKLAEQQLQTAASAASTPADATTTATTTAAATEAKITAYRLRATLRSAATVAAAMKRAGVAVDSVVSESVKEAMGGMRGSDIQEVRGVMANLLAVAGVGELDVMRRVREKEEAERRQRRLKLQDEAQKERKAKEEADKVEAINNKGEERVKKERRQKANKHNKDEQHEDSSSSSGSVKVEDGQQKQSSKHTAKSEQQSADRALNGQTNGRAANGQHKQHGKDKTAIIAAAENGTSRKHNKEQGDRGERADIRGKAHHKDKSGERMTNGEGLASPSSKTNANERANSKKAEHSDGYGKDKQQRQKQKDERQSNKTEKRK